MRQFSVDNFKNDLKDLFSVKGFELEIVNDSLKIKKREGSAEITISLLENLEEELSKIKLHSPYIASGEGVISFILYDKNEEFNEGSLEIEGEMRGTFIKENILDYGVIYCNLGSLIDFEKLEHSFSISETEIELDLAEVFQDNIVVVDLDVTTNNGFYHEEDVSSIEKIIDSTIYSLKYQNNILLYNPRNDYNISNESSSSDKVHLKVIKDIEPVKYFLSAEELSFPHLKYLEYYHVFEFYFMHNAMREFDGKISDLLSLKLAGKTFRENEYFLLMQETYKHFANKDVKEDVQLEELFFKDIGYSAIATFINDNLEDLKIDSKKVFLQNPLYGIEQTVVSCYKEYSENGKDLPLKVSVPTDKAKIFCQAIAKRVYKLRNFIVHTKKGERDNVFIPTNANFQLLELDLKFARYLASVLLLSMSIE